MQTLRRVRSKSASAYCQQVLLVALLPCELAVLVAWQLVLLLYNTASYICIRSVCSVRRRYTEIKEHKPSQSATLPVRNDRVLCHIQGSPARSSGKQTSDSLAQRAAIDNST
jgi:hypothetical protein